MRVALKPNDCRRTPFRIYSKTMEHISQTCPRMETCFAFRRPLVCLLIPLVWGFQPSSITVTFAMNWGIHCKPRYDPGIHCTPGYDPFPHLASGNIVSKLFIKLMVTKNHGDISPFSAQEVPQWPSWPSFISRIWSHHQFPWGYFQPAWSFEYALVLN